MARKDTPNGDVAPSHDLPTWWLDEAALPELFWAAVVSGLDGVRVHLQGGRMIIFDDPDDVIRWLCEEEFSPLDELRADGDVASDVVPPADFFQAPA